jgi:hypothetical protein
MAGVFGRQSGGFGGQWQRQRQRQRQDDEWTCGVLRRLQNPCTAIPRLSRLDSLGASRDPWSERLSRSH